jgi:hypothetical protein
LLRVQTEAFLCFPDLGPHLNLSLSLMGINALSMILANCRHF